MGKIDLFEDALPETLFNQLVDAVQAVGTERIDNKGSYNTRFWFPRGANPTNIVEQCIAELVDLVRPGPECIGMEWWLGRLQYGESLRFHTDRDRSLRKQTGQIVHPLLSSILYLNHFPASPTVILDQVLGPDGKSWIHAKATSRRTLDAVPNHYVVFRGDLRHGVVANGEGDREHNHLRLTLLVNYWHRRPIPPNCRDYDATIYPSLQYVSNECSGERSLSQSPQWNAWDKFVEATSETGFMQSSWWVDFRNTCGFENFGITLKDAGEIVAGAVVLTHSYEEGHSFYYIQDGPILGGDPDVAREAFRVILKTIEEHRKSNPDVVSHLRIEPRWECLPDFVSGFQPVPPLADRFMEPRDSRCIDLRPSVEAILAQMKPKGRYNIGVARRHGVSVIEDSSVQGLADFQNIYEETAERQAMQAKPPDYFEDLLSLSLPMRRAALFFAEYQGVRLATALVIYFGRKVTYFFGGSRDIYREVMAPYLLHFEIMRKAKKLGYERYDLWGIAPTGDTEHPWINLSTFKAKFGGVELHLVRALDYVYDSAAYSHYMAAEMKPSETLARDGSGLDGCMGASHDEND